MSNPKISVVTPSFNQGKFIEETILSVLDQNYPNLDFWVIDGKSTDNTVSILRKYSGKLSWISEKDNNQTHAINKGLKRSKGEIVCYLNSDDILEKGALGKVAKYFGEHKNIFWVTGKCRVINETGEGVRSLITLYKYIWLKLFRSHEALINVNYVSQPATFWRREIFSDVGFFNEKLNFTMDYDYWLRISKIYPLGFIDDYLASFRIHDQSKSSRNVKSAFDEDYLTAVRHNKASLPFHHLHNRLTVFIYDRIT